MHDSPYGVPAPDHRLPPDTRLGPVRLQVADLDRSMTYYRTVLGAHELERASGTVTLGGPDQEPLVVLVERPGAHPVPRRGRLGLFHYAILLPERAALGTFVRHLVALDEPFGASDHLVSEAVYLYDPDGLGIEVYADRPRSAWRRQGRQLLMATDPMDLDGVVAAGEGRAWDGLPPGTRMGHVHLHVGDLDEASSFYHEALGLDSMVWSYPGALFLAAGGYHHHLGLNTWARGAPPPADDEARLLEWEMVLPRGEDVENAVRSVEGRGRAENGSGDRAEEPVSPAQLPAATEEGSVLSDPWGTRLRLRAARRGGGEVDAS